MKNKERIKYLLDQYMKGNATDEEHEQLFHALNSGIDVSEWELLLQQMAEQQPEDAQYSAAQWEPMLTKIIQKSQPNIGEKPKPMRKLFIIRPIAAAMIILIIGIGTWLGFKNAQPQMIVAPTKMSPSRKEVLPGGNKAILTLSNGAAIVLDSAHNGLLARQGGSQILKLNNGLLSYNKNQAHPDTILYNTITTPHGGQYQLVLSDGTKVWLNAASSLRFPTSFTGKDRQVTLTGEAYFEVVHHKNHPFKVQVGSIQVEDLGTHFNVMAYHDEGVVKTTLLEGAIKVSKGDAAKILVPGQQARLYKSDEIKVVENVNLTEAVAWKNGLFEFTSADVASIMRQIARWYDVEIVYADGISSGHITGKIPRNTNLSNVLKMLQLSGVHFKTEGRQVIVLPE